jgi:hypothetical protein
MTADEALKRLAVLATEIERHQTAIWLAEQERAEVRTELRRALYASGGEASQPPAGDRSRPEGLAPPERQKPLEPATYAAIQPQIGAGPYPAATGPKPRRTVY